MTDTRKLRTSVPVPVPSATGEPSLTVCLLIAAAVCLGSALQLGSGTLNRYSFGLMLAGGALLLALLALPRQGMKWPGESAAWCVLTAALMVLFRFLCTSIPGMYVRLQSFDDLSFFFSMMVAAIMLCGILIGNRIQIGRYVFPLLLVCYLAAASWMVIKSPEPTIDVFTMHRESCDALLQGTNPYAITLPNIYRSDQLFPEGTVVNGRVMFGYTYPPLTLLLSLPGHMLGDYRFAEVFAIAAGAALVAYAAPGNWSFLAVALLLFTPRGFFIVEQGWTECYLVLMMGLVVFTAARKPNLLPYAFGLLLASKQHMVLAAPLALLLIPRPWTMCAVGLFGLKSIVSAASVTLPFVLWNAGAHLHSVYAVNMKVRIRPDSLSFNAWLNTFYGMEIGMAAQLLAVSLITALVLWRCPRTTAGFCQAMSLLYLVFFNCHKTAFANHYFFLITCVTFAVTMSAPMALSPARTAGSR